MLLVTSLDCGGTDILRLIKIIFKFIDIIFFVVPFVLIIMMAIDFFKSLLSGKEDDMKKNLNMTLKRILSCILLFLVPTIVNIITGMIGTDYSQCITLAKQVELFANESISGSDNQNSDFISGSNNNSNNDVTKKTTTNNKTTKTTTTNNNETIKTTTKVTTKIATTTTTKKQTNSRKNIFIGDSRCIGIQDSIDRAEENKSEWICKVSQGYSWFKTTAISTLNSKIKPNEYYNIYINLGVNDVYNISSYINYFNNMRKDSKYSNCNIIVVSVNPVDDSRAKSYGYMITNNDVINFNSKMESGLDDSISYCDVYSKIKNNFQTVDGLHYNSSTSKSIYNHIINCK